MSRGILSQLNEFLYETLIFAGLGLIPDNHIISEH